MHSTDAVNLAARLCDGAADGEILLSPRAYAAVEDQFAAESTGEISLKGIHAAVPDLLYGAGIGSSYQGQELRLSKHFKAG